MMTLTRLLTGLRTAYLKICLWMERNEQKLNKEKTDILIHSKFRNSPSLDEIIPGNEQLTVAKTVTNLGIIFDQEISFNDQMNQLCRTSFFFLRNLSKIRKCLTDEASSIKSCTCFCDCKARLLQPSFLWSAQISS